MKPIIEIHDLIVTLGGNKIIDRLDVEVSKGEKVAVAGGSGTGKTTLLHVIMGYTAFSEGSITIFGKALNREDIHDIRSQIAWLPQELSLPVDTMNGLLTILFQFKKNRDNKPGKEEIEDILNRFGLAPDMLDLSFSALSGGQKQRTIMAACILLKKPLLLLDEPTSALDSDSINRIIDYIQDLKQLTVLSTSHNKQWLEQCDKVININQ